MKNILFYLLFGLCCYGQENRGELLLFKISIERDVEIENRKNFYMAIELETDSSIKDSSIIMDVFFDGFQDSDIVSCTKNDSIEISTAYVSDTYEHDEIYLEKYAEVIKRSEDKMTNFMNVNIKSPLFEQKVNISYILLNAHYCKGFSTKRDAKMIGIGGGIILIIDEIVFNTKFKISKENMYDIMKAIDINNIIYN